MARAKRMARPASLVALAAGAYRTFIFFGSGLTSVSPAVSLWWPGKVINLFKQLPAETLVLGTLASEVCAHFIGACSALQKAKLSGSRHRSDPGQYLRIQVSSLALRWEGQELLTAAYDTPEHAEQWRAWFFAEIERLCANAQHPPILVDLDPPFHVTQGGTVLFQRHSGRDFQQGDPLWLTPSQADRLAKARAAALKRRPKPTGMSVDEYEALFRERLEAAGFDFNRPNRKVACRVLYACDREPVACDDAFMYGEAGDDGIELGRWFVHGPVPHTARHERVGIRLSSPKLRGYEFQSSGVMCGSREDVPTFRRLLGQMFTSGPDRLVSRWHAELRRYEPT
jgi:hypothetical protein